MLTTMTPTRRATATTTSHIAESVGALLRQAREENGLSVQDVAARTKIPEKYVVLFEGDAHDELSDDVYTKIYLKAYGKFLGFDTVTVLEHYRRERARVMAYDDANAPKPKHPTTTIPASQLVVTPKLIQNALLAVVALGIAAYFGFELKTIVAPPDISLAAPRDGMVTTERSVTVEGKTEGEVTLRINGKQVNPDDRGNFKDTLELQEGLNLITVVGAKKHSKEMTLTRRVIVTPKDRPAALLPAAPPSTP
jgi:transcriptional regulator with XRE-family HTH domain